MKQYIIKDTCIINEGQRVYSDLLIRKGRIEKIAPSIGTKEKNIEINGRGHFLSPGAGNAQVQFLEPCLIHKRTI